MSFSFLTSGLKNDFPLRGDVFVGTWSAEFNPLKLGDLLTGGATGGGVLGFTAIPDSTGDKGTARERPMEAIAVKKITGLFSRWVIAGSALYSG
jgi:hypothetical protein